MTPLELRTAMRALGHTQHSFAATMLMGKWGWQSVGKWVRGEVPIPGPVAVAVDLMLEMLSSGELPARYMAKDKA